jgi:hypothetical protein
MDEYLSYLATEIKNRQAFLLNFPSDLRTFQSLFHALRSTWARVGNERDKSGKSHAGLLPFGNVLARHVLIGFQHLTSYQSFLGWLTFRPGLEALLIIGKFVDDPQNARIWSNRLSDWKSYQKMFSGSALESKSLPQSAAFRKVLGHLNDDFMHPNPNFAFREATQTQTTNSVVLEIQCFDLNSDIHEAHLLAYIGLLEELTRVSVEMLTALLGAPAAPTVIDDYCGKQAQ